MWGAVSIRQPTSLYKKSAQKMGEEMDEVSQISYIHSCFILFFVLSFSALLSLSPLKPALSIGGASPRVILWLPPNPSLFTKWEESFVEVRRELSSSWILDRSLTRVVDDPINCQSELLQT